MSKVIKNGRVSFNVESFKDFTKEQFFKTLKGTPANLVEVWNQIEEIYKNENTESNFDTSKKSKKGDKRKRVDESVVSESDISEIDH